MEEEDLCVYKCDIEIKEEPFDYDGESNETSSETVTEPSTSNAVCNDESTLPYDSYDHVTIKEEELEIAPEPDYDEIGEFCFESDHVALKSNIDYKKLLEAIFILETQRAQAIKDLDDLYKLQEQALADPIAFVEKLQNQSVNFSAPTKIHQLPIIDWSKYVLSSNTSLGRRQQTRLAAKVPDFTKFGIKGKLSQKGLVDQKVKLNQYWTAEEQKRLEELLIQFPPEEVESRRWEKIANCLENRTPVQVASRVQKYFIKLMRHGMPIPGRMPSTVHLKKHRRNVIRRNPSTFLVSHQPPVYMPDGEDDFSYSCSQPPSTEENSMESKMDASDEEDIKPELKNLPEYQELMLLKKALKEKQRSSGLAHIGYKCCRCKVEPIMGTRWHCTECKTQSVDFCPDCCESEYEFDQHISDHHLEAIQQARTSLIDREYTHFMGSDYNYLDPNYMPAM